MTAFGAACGSDEGTVADVGVSDTGSNDTGASDVADTGSVDTTPTDTVDEEVDEDTAPDADVIGDTADTEEPDTAEDADTADAADTDATDAEDTDTEEPPLYTGAVTDPDNSANISDFIDSDEVNDERAANPDAMFDGVLGESPDDSTWTRVWYGQETGNIGREWRCSVQLNRVEVHAPDGGLLFAGGENGKVTLYGHSYDTSESDSTESYDDSTVLAVKYVTGDTPPNPVVFDVDDLPAQGFVAHTIAFEVDLPDGSIHENTRVRVSEVVFRGGCVGGEEDEIVWAVSDWTCPAECVEAVNNSIQERSVWCERNGEDRAHEDLCPDEKPASVGEACVYECPYVLVYIGDYDFTYANDSGWLHEGHVGRRAGPLPREVEMGTTIGAIEGKPCSFLTTDPLTRLFGFRCDGEGAGTYCTFQCLEPDVE